MSKQKIQQILSSSHCENKKVKVIFKEFDERYPMIGIFVRMNDYEELMSKGMVRFVNQSRLDYFLENNKQTALTRIYVIKDFSQVIIM